MSAVALAPWPTTVPTSPRLLDQLRALALARFGRPEPGQRYADWVVRYILFHGKRHPRDLGAQDVTRFLEHVAQTEKDPLRCLEQAREALSFLFRNLLGLDLGDLPLPEPPRLLDRVRFAIRVRHYSPRTEACYVEWVERFIRFHGLRHPNTMGGPEVEMFLTDLAVHGHVSASTQNQAREPVGRSSGQRPSAKDKTWQRSERSKWAAARWRTGDGRMKDEFNRCASELHFAMANFPLAIPSAFLCVSVPLWFILPSGHLQFSMAHFQFAIASPHTAAIAPTFPPRPPGRPGSTRFLRTSLR